jgi:TonB family protein
MKKTLFPVLLLLTCYCSKAQQDTVVTYFNAGWKPTSAAKAVYYRVAFKTDYYWTCYDFYADIDKPQMRGFFLDDSLRVKEGPFLYYHRNGKLQSKGNYLKNEKEGLWLSWNEAGSLNDSTFYVHGMLHRRMVYRPDGSLSNRVGPNSTGRIISQGFFPDGRLSHTGQYENGKKQGDWVYFYDGGKQEVYYERDSATRYTCLDTNGHVQTDCIYERAAEAPKRWQSFIATTSAKYLPQAYREGRISGTVMVRFIVDTDGWVRDPVVVYSSEPALNETALQVIRSSPKWKPGIQFNTKVKSYYTQPFTFVRAQ